MSQYINRFDAGGSQFDAGAKTDNWRTEDGFAHFKAAGEALAAQFGAYKQPAWRAC